MAQFEFFINVVTSKSHAPPLRFKVVGVEKLLRLEIHTKHHLREHDIFNAIGFIRLLIPWVVTHNNWWVVTFARIIIGKLLWFERTFWGHWRFYLINGIGFVLAWFHYINTNNNWQVEMECLYAPNMNKSKSYPSLDQSIYITSIGLVWLCKLDQHP